MRRISIATVFILTTITLFGCAKKQEQTSSSGSASTASSTSGDPGGSAKPLSSADLGKCAGCLNISGAGAHWTFTGSYRDAKCTEPVATADFHPCQVVTIPQTAQVRFSDSVGTHKKAETSEIKLNKPMTPEESVKLYKKADDGACIAVTSGFKVVPNDCDGKRVCLDANKKLTCNAADCASLPNNCPQFETARMLLTFAP